MCSSAAHPFSRTFKRLAEATISRHLHCPNQATTMSWLDGCGNSLTISASACAAVLAVPLRTSLKPRSDHIPPLVKNFLYLLISPRVKSYQVLPTLVPNSAGPLLCLSFLHYSLQPYRLLLSSNRPGMFLLQDFCMCCSLCLGQFSSGEPHGCSLTTITSLTWP